ncbi:MAG: thioredoxin fold domain-containing protein [Anaerolineae bacterium]|nr:thioredoxin fold domain-containing protein [Anaerolineae bacterium]
MHHFTFEVNKQDFGAQVLESTLPVLIEFTADWCPPCKMLAPIVNELAHKYEGKLRVGLLDSDDNPEVVQQYGVMGLPTLILFLNGAPAERIVGFTSRERIEAKLLPHLAAANA